MGKKILFYSAGLIALYLIVVNAAGFTSDVNASATGATSLVKGFQGRG
ncbi:MAG TPA: hypothetical protein VGS97_26100 [Actinocrinis sp.]|nr:hypothetical protein [Actinocrinis sp.]HEV2347591.1 hypothetical protein [Actinocrinis sp.]